MYYRSEDERWTRWSPQRLSRPWGCPMCPAAAHTADETETLSVESQHCLISEAYKYYAYKGLHPLEWLFSINYDGKMMINCEGCGSCHCLFQQTVPTLAWKGQLSIAGALVCCCWDNLSTLIAHGTIPNDHASAICLPAICTKTIELTTQQYNAQN
jgi:hypothetical protein